MDIRKFFFRIYWKIQEVIVPTLNFSQLLYEDVLEFYVNPNIKWIDIGCGHQILPAWRSKEEKCLVENCETIVGVDYDLNSLKNHKNIFLKLRGDISKLPIKSKSFDLVTANMVVEHLDNPDAQFREIVRILKPGGLFIFHTPNLLGYSTIISRLIPEILKPKLIYLTQGRKEEDIFDTYYKVNTQKKINCLAEKTGFEVVKLKMIVSAAQFVFFPPLVILELFWIKILMNKQFKPLRTNIIAILKKRKTTL